MLQHFCLQNMLPQITSVQTKTKVRKKMAYLCPKKYINTKTKVHNCAGKPQLKFISK